MTGICPSFFFPAGFLQNVQKCFVFFTALRTYIKVFANKRHELSGVLLIDLSFHVLVNPGVHFITRNIIFPHTLEHAQESQHGRIGKLLMMVETVSNLLDDGADLHNLCL